jgi:uncharacterized protein YpmS
MKINYWKATTIILTCFLMIVLGYESSFWLRPTDVRAQETEAAAPAGRFQLLQTNTKMDVLLDTATGRLFNIYGTSFLQEFPIKSCVDAECTTRKGTKDAR